MKKICTLLILVTAFLSFKGTAQIVSCNLVVTWTSQPESPNSNVIHFTNSTVDYVAADTVSWTFGDGSTSSLSNPVHAYTSAGVKQVCLIIKKAVPAGAAPCINYSCQSITVAMPNTACNLAVSYTSQALAGQPNVIQFTSTSTGYAVGDTIQWTFGDGSSSSTLNPLHTFTTNGTFHICLIIRKAVSPGASQCVNYSCHDIAITIPVQCTLSASFTTQPSTSNPLGVYFSNTSTGFVSGDSIRWSFGDGTYAYTPTAYHAYANGGTYNVCLWVKKNNIGTSVPCVSEICHTVTVTAPATCNLVVSYTSQPAANQPNVIQFTSTGTGYTAADTIQWTFGDGTTSSSLNPLHTYTTAGTYQVCLIVRKTVTPGTAPCVNYSCHAITVTMPVTCTLSASFTSQASTSNSLGVYFTNTSTGFATGDSIRWSFGDGTYAYTPTAYHAYANAGTYNVCLWVKKNNFTGTTPCVSEICHTVTVSAPCNLVVNFTSQPSTVTPNVIQFTSTSTGYAAGDSILWTFGDNTTSNSLNPLHTYATGGTYHVCLIIRKHTATGATACVNYSCHDIVVQSPCTLTSNYTWHADAQNYKLIHFTNTTPVQTNATVTWYFGDGGTATSWNADHTYAQAGTYYACLRIQSGTCVSYHCDSVRVIEPPTPCAQLANFHFTTVSATGLYAVFTPDHVYSDVTYTWTFGDGTGSHDVPATHQFPAAGYYTVCLTAYRNNTCASTSCQIVQLPAGVNCSNITLGFNYTVNPTAPNSITFTTISNAATTDQVWTINRIPATTVGYVTLHANNPTYAFSDTGNYNVCLHATFANGCVKEYCRMIHVSYPVSGTNACSLQVYPNPAMSTVNAVVTLTQPLTITVVVYNSSNIQVLQKDQQGVIGSNTVALNVANLAPGVYTMRVSYGTQFCYATFIKQ